MEDFPAPLSPVNQNTHGCCFFCLDLLYFVTG
jgi:hypothetical protein